MKIDGKIEKIAFGTDGWRGIIARDFTFENVKIAAQAVVIYLKKGLSNKNFLSHRVMIGYDGRFLSNRFALATAEVLAGNGIKVVVSNHPIPGPALSFSVVNEKAKLGIMITASHNPYEYNGFKIKTESGAPADRNTTNQIEKYLYKCKPRTGGEIEYKDLLSPYIKKVSSLVDMELLGNAEFSIVFDPMFGSGRDLLPEILKDSKCKVISIHSSSDPLFGGLRPEPIRKNLNELAGEVIRRKADTGIATDGDADRVGVIDETGRYLTPHQVFPLLISYLVEVKKKKGKVVQTISMGYLGERIANFYGLPFQEVPVGFKYVSEVMLKEDVLIGGEESGGYGYSGYIPERDGILSALILLEMIARKGRRLSWILTDLQRRFGRSCYERMDIRIPQNSGMKSLELKEKITGSIVKKAPGKIAGMKIRELRTYDGVKFILGSENITGGEAWLLLRPSGTEPLIRIYAEADSLKRVKELLKEGRQMLSNYL